MTHDLALRCTCGQLQGTARDVGPRRAMRLICYCRDCQCFAHFLGRPELLDHHGGSEVVQMSPARVTFHVGQHQLVCMRLSPKGLMRWHTSCCNTPIANTLDKPKLPFVGVLSSCWDPSLDADARERLMGPVQGRVNGPGHAAADGSMAPIDPVVMRVIKRSLWIILGAKFRGEHKPSPFFDVRAGRPRVTPHVISLAERAALLAKVDAQMT